MNFKFQIQAGPPHQRDGERNQGSRASPASKLTFVNIDRPAQIKNPTTQRKIRRHVMRDIGRSRRRDTAGGTMTVSRSLPRNIPTYWGDVRICVNFQQLFWAMDMVSEGLLALAMTDPGHKFRRRLDSTLEDGVLRQNQRKMSADEASLDDMRQYTESIALVRQSIVEPESPASRHAIIGSIICLALFDMRMRNHERWTMHMTGLENVVHLGGGVDALETCPPVRHSLFIADVLGSLVADVPPRFQAPPLAIPSPLEVRKLSSFQDFRLFSSFDETSKAIIDSALSTTKQLATLLSSSWNGKRLKLDLMMPVCTLTHDVLSLPRMMEMAPASAAAELVRISVLAMLSTVISTMSGDMMYCAVLRKIDSRKLFVQCEAGAWDGWAELKLWTLAIKAMLHAESGSIRSWLLDEMVVTMSTLSLQSWDDLMSSLQKVVWVERAATPELAQLKGDLEKRHAFESNN